MSMTHDSIHFPDGRRLSRRQVLRLGLVGTIGLFLTEVLAATLAYFWPRRFGTFGSRVNLGPTQQFAVGSITTFVEGKLFLSRLPEGFLALYWKCPHLGCTVQWHPEEETLDTLATMGRFHCPCHNSMYDRHGQIVVGPAPRPMDLFQLSEENGQLVVDTSKVTQRPHWKPEQALKRG
jgi:cytochrome b6-f complex iron-sulfur subunit